MYHFPGLGSASDWTKQSFKQSEALPVVMRHQYGISALISQTSFPGGKPVVASQNVCCFLRLNAKAELGRLSLQVLFSGINICKQ